MQAFHCLFFYLLFFATFFVMAHSLVESSMQQIYSDWMTQHGRVYKDSREKESRFKIFVYNFIRIEAFNRREKGGFKLGLNQFADMTSDEFRTSITGLNLKSTKPNTGFMYANDTDIPESIDWRKLGAVTPIKNQGSCGSCWAFSAVGSMEGINMIKNGKLISLSEQQLLDCDVNGTNNGCKGGYMDGAFDFIVKNKGLATEEVYPYTGKAGVCDNDKLLMVSATISGYENVPANDEKALQMAVANQPVSVAVDAAGFEFQFYRYGVMSGYCSTQLNHGMVVVGYGVSESDESTGSGRKYWLLKNSWGENWGEDGYVRMERDIIDEEGMCGLAKLPSYPIV